MMLDCAHCPVRDRAACSALEPHEREALAENGRLLLMNGGQTLFRAGDDSTRCATLISGLLKVVSIEADGTEHILALIHPAGFVGELFTPFAEHDVVALVPSQLCVFGRGEITRALHAQPRLTEALLRRSQADLHASRALLALSVRRSARQKVAGLLLALARSASQSPCHPAPLLDLPLSRADMASLLGLTIESVSRQISALERDGLIRRNGPRNVELCDSAALEQTAA
ncbi:Crp/Fnr family transcriptional regulator [Novosphingobium sp.]|uniref:Crp/Fnr family transcriptional regulator n=1 Tax=Novosphingobium sp. TaxID=1874826 RepID=UPI0025FC9EE7|nr:Crp/Fnr family transcriptional regulator [Novosphingobium sp.]